MVQPPASSAYLRDHINQLIQEATTLERLEPKKASFPENPVEAYTQQILDWISSLPESQQKQGYSMTSIVKLAYLKGIYVDSPSPQKIAPALRKAGFKQMRSWKKIDRNIRLWVWTLARA